MPAITLIRLARPNPKRGGERTAIGYLYLARKALYAAIKAEKKELEEEYIDDNNIYLLLNNLEALLENRLIEIN